MRSKTTDKHIITQSIAMQSLYMSSCQSQSSLCLSDQDRDDTILEPKWKPEWDWKQLTTHPWCFLSVCVFINAHVMTRRLTRKPQGMEVNKEMHHLCVSLMTAGLMPIKCLYWERSYHNTESNTPCPCLIITGHHLFMVQKVLLKMITIEKYFKTRRFVLCS